MRIMRLAYLYIAHFRNFSDKEFNFTQNFCIHYNKDEMTLSINRKESILPENFWGKNIQDLSMIVGNNGAGKTGIMQFIIRLFINMSRNTNSSNHNTEECGFAVFEENNQFYSYILGNLEVKCTAHGITDMYKVLGRTKLIYLTNVLSAEDSRRNSYPQYGRYSFFYDCSVSALFHADKRNDVYSERHSGNQDADLDTYFAYEQYKQIKFVFDQKQSEILNSMKEDGFPVPVPQKLYIEVIMEDNLNILLPQIHQVKWKTSLTRFTFGFELLWSNEFQNLPDHKAQEIVATYFPYILARCAVRSLFSSILRYMPHNSRAKILEWSDQWAWIQKDGKEFFKYLVEWICNIILADEYGGSIIPNKDYLSSARNLCSIKDTYMEFLDFIFDKGMAYHFQFIDPKRWLTWDYSTFRCSIDTSDDWLITFVQKYRYICNPDYFLNFDWGLSSGERNLISLFSSLYYVFDRDYSNRENGPCKIYNKWEEKNSREEVECNSLILMLDEADLTYHPEWQREFIRILTGFVTRIYPPYCCPNIQILISTHSPILLSDMPGDNVLYLKYAPEEKVSKADKLEPTDAEKKYVPAFEPPLSATFGQNIYMLFRNNFFLEKGTIGAFAQKKLLDLIQQLGELEKRSQDRKCDIRALEHELNQCWALANLVGEPIIQGKLKLRIQQIANQIRLPEQKDDLEQLSDDDLNKRIEQLQREQERRRNDQDQKL